MSMAGAAFERCPKCIAPVRGGLDPFGNRCHVCGHVFDGAQAISESYSRKGRHLPDRKPTAAEPATDTGPEPQLALSFDQQSTN